MKSPIFPAGINRVSQIKQWLSSVLTWVKPEQHRAVKGQDCSNPTIFVPCSVKSEGGWGKLTWGLDSLYVSQHCKNQGKHKAVTNMKKQLLHITHKATQPITNMKCDKTRWWREDVLISVVTTSTSATISHYQPALNREASLLISLLCYIIKVGQQKQTHIPRLYYRVLKDRQLRFEFITDL